MKIKYHKNFIKNYKKRIKNSPKLKKQFQERLSLFLKNPRHPILRNHQLTGSKKTLSAFSVTGDVRVVYKKISSSEIVLLGIGTHNQVY